MRIKAFLIDGEAVAWNSWEDIDRSIREHLSKPDRSIDLQIDGEAWALTLGSTDHQSYFASVIHRGKTYTLQNPGAPDEQVETMVGGQLGSLNAKILHDYRTVLRAAKTFAETGEPDPALAWKTKQL